MSESVYVVNAFTANGENGNPAGVMPDADDMNKEAMLHAATEVNLSETAFVGASEIATKRVRFFTPTVEVPLCGHATIATWSLLHQLGDVAVGIHTQETNAGILQVEVEDSGLVFMEQTPATFYDEIEPNDIAGLLGIEEADFLDSLRPQIVSTGIKDLLIPVSTKSVLSKVKPDLEGIAEFSRQHDISGFHLFAILDDNQSMAATRNFAPADGIPEECATGTSNGALLCLLRQKGLLPEQDIYRIEQGETMNQLSYIYGTFKGENVWIGGEATVKDSPAKV